jgi:hypothetical protein
MNVFQVLVAISFVICASAFESPSLNNSDSHYGYTISAEGYTVQLNISSFNNEDRNDVYFKNTATYNTTFCIVNKIYDNNNCYHKAESKYGNYKFVTGQEISEVIVSYNLHNIVAEQNNKVVNLDYVIGNASTNCSGDHYYVNYFDSGALKIGDQCKFDMRCIMEFNNDENVTHTFDDMLSSDRFYLTTATLKFIMIKMLDMLNVLIIDNIYGNSSEFVDTINEISANITNFGYSGEIVIQFDPQENLIFGITYCIPTGNFSSAFECFKLVYDV